MHGRLILQGLACVATTLAFGAGADSSPIGVESPNGVNRIDFEGTGDPAAPIGIRISRSGRALVQFSGFSVGLARHGELSGTSTLGDVDRDTVDETFALHWGKSSSVRHHANRASVSLASPGGIKWAMDFAAFDDGVAYRYRLPAQAGFEEFTLTAESTDVRFVGDPMMHYTEWGGFLSSHETEFLRASLSTIDGPLVDLPLLAVWPDGSAVGVTEARLRNFSSLYLERTPERGPGALRTRLSPLRETPDACMTGRPPIASPWRVVLMGDRAGDLLESNLLVCLNDPPTGDFHWVNPGKSTWHWWNGTFVDESPFDPGMNLETHKRYIDFCAENGIAYHAVVADARPWHVQEKAGYAPQPDTDILTPRPELRLPEILAYARERKIGIRLWVHWKPLDARLEEAFQLYEDWGISGLMVDFLDSDDQYMVNFCERVLESAARHKLHVQFHGSYKPSGEERTFPNLFNREGVLNLEYDKWGDRCAPPHNVEVAYVRALAGPLDYHLGGFRSISRKIFVARNENPFVLGTRCHNLAMYVVYDNPMPMVADSPEAYEGQSGFDFIVGVPVTWDETRFVTGDAGEYIVVARRHGDAWYLGGMTNWTPRDVTVPLDFLSRGTYQAQLYVDGSMDEEKPNAIRSESLAVESGGSLEVKMASGGGFTAVITRD